MVYGLFVKFSSVLLGVSVVLIFVIVWNIGLSCLGVVCRFFSVVLSIVGVSCGFLFFLN